MRSGRLAEAARGASRSTALGVSFMVLLQTLHQYRPPTVPAHKAPVALGGGGNGKPPDGGSNLPPPDAAAGPACGDGALDPGEQCDDGNTTAGDGCDGSCK